MSLYQVEKLCFRINTDPDFRARYLADPAVAISRFGPDARVELVTPARPGSPIEGFLAQRGPGLHHVAFQVDEPLASVLEQLAEDGIEAVGEIVPSSDGRPSVFLHPRTTGGILVELVQGPRP